MNAAGAADPPHAAPRSPQNPLPRPRRDSIWTAAAVLGCVLIALLVHGYSWELGAENQPLQIPLIERLKDPALFPGDPLVDALSQQKSLFFPVIAWISRWFAVELQFFVLHLLTTGAAAMAIAAVTRVLTGSRSAAFIAAFLLLTSPIVRPTLLGRDTTVASWVTPTTVSFPVLLVALRFLLAGRAGTAGALAGLAANLNLVMAGLFMIVALPVAVGETRGVRSGARLGSGFALAGLPALAALPEGSMLWGRGLDFVSLLRRYYPYHFFLGVQPPSIFLRAAILLAAAVACFPSLPAGAAKSRALRMAIAVGVAIAAGSLFADVLPIAPITQLHLLRADRWFLVLLFAAAGAAIAGASAGPRRWPFAGGLALAAGLARGAYPLIAWGALVLLLIPRASHDELGDERSSDGHPRPWLLLLLLAAAGIAVERLWDPGYRASAVLLAALVMMALIPARLGVPALRPRHARPWFLGPVMAIAILELSRSNGTLGARGLALARPVFDPDWREVQEWAAHATPLTAKFLTPPQVPGFRVYAQRGTVVEWKDGAAMLWEPTFGAGWWERQAEVSEAIASRDIDRLRTTARRYGAGWIVVPAHEAPPAMIPVHANPRFRVFTADGRSAR